MSKTLHVEGSTGKVAVMEGDYSATVFNNPQSNTDKLYFHSDLDYMYKIGTYSFSFSLPRRTTSATNQIVLGSTYIPQNFVYKSFPYIASSPIPDGVIVQKYVANPFDSSSGWQIVTLRQIYLTTTYNSTTGLLTFYLEDVCVASTFYPSSTYANTYTFTIYGCKNNYVETSQSFIITPSSCVFLKGKFDSTRNYATIGSGYPIYYSNPYTITLGAGTAADPKINITQQPITPTQRINI